MAKKESSLNFYNINWLTDAYIRVLDGIDYSSIKEEDVYIKRDGEFVKISEIYSLRKLVRILRKFNILTKGKNKYIRLHQYTSLLMSKLSGNELKVMMYFFYKMNYNSMIYLDNGYKDIQKSLNLSMPTIRNVVGNLKEMGYIAETENSSIHRRIYAVNPAVAIRGGELQSKYVNRYFKLDKELNFVYNSGSEE